MQGESWRRRAGGREGEWGQGERERGRKGEGGKGRFSRL